MKRLKRFKRLGRIERLKMIAVVTGYLLLLPVLLPYAAIEMTLAQRRMKSDAEALRCTKCGYILGRTSLQKADEYYREAARERSRRFPNVRFLIVRDIWAICSVCGARYNYSGDERKFVLKHDQ